MFSAAQHGSASFSMAQHGSAQHCMLMHRFEHEMHNPHTPPKGPCTPLGPLGQPCIPMVTNMAIQHNSAHFSMVQLSSAQHPLAMHGFAGGVHSPHAPPKGPCTPLGPPRAHGTRHNTPKLLCVAAHGLASAKFSTTPFGHAWVWRYMGLRAERTAPMPPRRGLVHPPAHPGSLAFPH